MNYQYKYYPEPGITYDIIRMLYVKLNANSIWKETLTTVACQEEHLKFIEEHAKLLPDPDPDLALFAYIPTNRKTTFLSTVADELIPNDFQTYTINNLYEYTNDISKVKDSIFNYYFSEGFFGSSDFEYQLRASRTIPDRIKLLLFGFSYNPTVYITKLNNLIQSYYELISKYWNVDFISNDMLNQFINKMMGNNPIFLNRLTSGEQIPFSLCRCTPMHILFSDSFDNFFFITTTQTIIDKVTREISMSTTMLLELLHALDDQYRLSILQLLKLNGEMTTQEFSDKLNLSLTATKYHLAILRKANMISFKRINRSTHYSYNSSGYDALQKALDVYKKGGMKQ